MPPTPRSEPVPSTRVLTPQEATTMFLASLLQSASDFLGKPILGAVITAPPFFTQTQKDALKKAAEDAGVRVLQLLDEASAVLATTTSSQWPHGGEDRTQLVVDVGASSLSLSVIALRAGLGYTLGSKTSTNTANIGGDALSALLVKHFAKEFTKKTKTALPQPPSSKEDIRATTKLLLALEYTKRTLSASPAPASLSVESLHSGLDFTATIARMRFDLLATPVYTAISSEIKSLLESIALDPHDIDEITYVGGTACLPGLDSHLLTSVGFTEEVQTAFSNSTTGSGAIGDPTGVLSIGCALQAALLLRLHEESPDLVKAFEHSEEVKTTARTIGIIFPGGDDSDGLGGTYIPAIHKHTPLPARRIHEVEVTLSGGEGDKATKFGFEVWEVEEGIKVEKIAPPKSDSPPDEEDEDEEEEPEEIKTKTTTKHGFLGALLGETKGTPVKDKAKKGTYTAALQIEVTLGLDGVLVVEARDSKGEKQTRDHNVTRDIFSAFASYVGPAFARRANCPTPGGGTSRYISSSSQSTNTDFRTDFDPEDTLAGVEPAEDLAETTTTAREHYVDVGPSALRRLQSVADPKYAGVKTSRKQLMEDSDAGPSDLEEEEMNDPQGARDSESGVDSGNEEEDDEGESVPSQSEPEEGSDAGGKCVFPTACKIQTGPSVGAGTRRGSTFDPAENARRGPQEGESRCAANRAPSGRTSSMLEYDSKNRWLQPTECPPLSSHLAQYTEIEECRQSLDKMLEEAFLLSDELFELQEKLMSANESIVPPPRKRRRLQDDATPDYSTQLHEATNAVSALEHAYHPHLVQTLSKWSAKIQAVAPAALLPSNRNAFSSRNSQNLKSAVQLIDETLLDHRKLLARTQVRRGKGVRVGETTDAEEEEDGQVDADVFDDTDFYQQLLRDIIDSRGNGTGADDWMTVQKQKKAKKKVDTKASKGRKLRYEVHEKLQNFMVPVPVPGMWHEEQIDELFSSIMGRGVRRRTRTGGSSTGRSSLFRPPHAVQMEGFEDENPFESDSDRLTSATSSPDKVDLSEPPSPPANPSRQLSPTSPTQSRPFPSPGTARQPQATFKSDFCCQRDRVLHSGDDVEILITDAQKTSVNATSPYIVYVIQTGNAEARHRYSEFESLRLNLVKLYPTLIIPPIPSKQTIGDYAVKQAKAKEDAALIARRKRMLQTFLNRVARHPILSNDHVFHRFLDGEVSWSEVLNSPPLSLLPKNILKAPSHNPTDQNASPAYAALPNPSAAHPLRHPDQRFLDSEAFTNKFANHVSGPMEKVTRRTLKRWSDQAQDHADLGAALNGFSLHESGDLSGAIEKTGQAVDATYVSTTKLLQDLEQNWAEPLHEYTQFASIIKKLLAYRHQKNVQYEMTQDALESKREQLEELEKSEREARRLEQALGRGAGE
ncbi:Sorting nexin-41 [Mycena venus]|uniref:Protein BFR2 n=1 Tax=Mycena venus TaxID=2733690 RepID=A0A8H6Y9H5_9AGAR|nr:Sorting nexin-41 [Mycena venus]